MEYKVVPFVATIDPRNGTSDQVAKQLEILINQGASEGWSYVRLESVTTYVNADDGCFGFGGNLATRRLGRWWYSQGHEVSPISRD